MPDIEYRLFFDNTAASNQQLDMINQISVEQEVDMAWEARLQIPITVDEQGNWTGDDEDFMRAFSRVRVEIRIRTETFVPLIDGPIIGFDSQMSSEPGKSTLTIILQDDTFHLNREEQVVAFENKLDHEVAEQIYNDHSQQISSTRIDSTPSSGSALTPIVMQRGTAMQILRFLAKRQGMHAYVLPGENPGESIGCFNTFPTQPDGLPSLVLLGEERNIDNLQVGYCACKPSDVAASTLRITDKQVISEIARASDVSLIGDEIGEESSQVDHQILLPLQGESVDLHQAVSAMAQVVSYSYEVTGNILEDTYQAVLQPYHIITVRAGNTPVSGDYLISKITHTITRSAYSQSFSLKRNARSIRFGTGQSSLMGGIF